MLGLSILSWQRDVTKHWAAVRFGELQVEVPALVRGKFMGRCGESEVT